MLTVLVGPGGEVGEHGDGLVRSEWIEPMVGSRLTSTFAELKRAFDPKGLMNPGKIVAPTKMDDRTLFRYRPGYETPGIDTGLDWSAHEIGDHNRVWRFAAATAWCTAVPKTRAWWSTGARRKR